MFAPGEDSRKLAGRERLSVALKGRGRGRHSDGATVLAKGRGAVAEQILQVAFSQGVEVRTDAGLAEVLSCLDIESEIPIEALAIVSSLLNRVYDDQSPSTGVLREPFNLARGDHAEDNGDGGKVSLHDPDGDESAPKQTPEKF